MNPSTAIAWYTKSLRLAAQATTELDRTRALNNAERLRKIYQHLTGEPMPDVTP